MAGSVPSCIGFSKANVSTFSSRWGVITTKEEQPAAVPSNNTMMRSGHAALCSSLINS